MALESLVWRIFGAASYPYTLQSIHKAVQKVSGLAVIKRKVGGYQSQASPCLCGSLCCTYGAGWLSEVFPTQPEAPKHDPETHSTCLPKAGDVMQVLVVAAVVAGAVAALKYTGKDKVGSWRHPSVCVG